MRETVNQNHRIPFDNSGSEHLDRVGHQVHDGCRPKYRSVFPADFGWLFIFYVLLVLLQENCFSETGEQNSGSRRKLLPGMYSPKRDHDEWIYSPNVDGEQEPLVGRCSCRRHYRRLHIQGGANQCLSFLQERLRRNCVRLLLNNSMYVINMYS